MAKVDSVGRRPLLLGGVSAMVVALLALGAAELLLTGRVESYTSVAALLLYVGAYQARSTAKGAWVQLLGNCDCMSGAGVAELVLREHTSVRLPPVGTG